MFRYEMLGHDMGYLFEGLDGSESVRQDFYSEPGKTEVLKNCIGLDRLSTCNEVRTAMVFWSQGAFESGWECDTDDEMDTDFSDCGGILAEDLRWLALANEMPDCECN